MFSVCARYVMDVVFSEALSCECSCMGSVNGSSCRYCMFVSSVHYVIVSMMRSA